MTYDRPEGCRCPVCAGVVRPEICQPPHSRHTVTPFGVRPLILGSLLVAAVLAFWLLCGCASTPQQDAVGEGAPFAWQARSAQDAVLRRAILIGLPKTEDGLKCPGADIDVRTMRDWFRSDTQIAVLTGPDASLSHVRETFESACRDLRPQDLLVIGISSHGTTRPDLDGDEPPESEGRDQGVVLWDAIYWDDDVWRDLCAPRSADDSIGTPLAGFRLALITDTCYSAGNWRSVLSLFTLGLVPPPARQLEFGFMREAQSIEFAGQIIQLAACRSTAYAYGQVGVGGTWIQTLDRCRSPGGSWHWWFDKSDAMMPANQEPVWSTYNASEAFVNGEALR